MDFHIALKWPEGDARVSILLQELEKMPEFAFASSPFTSKMDIAQYMSSSIRPNVSASVLQNVCREMAMECLRDNIENECLQMTHMMHALHLSELQI